jgi:molybdopterin-guanine dinucleotide biosynthesis protein A
VQSQMSDGKTTSRRSPSAIILAGGQSSRMGEDKALIALHGVPLLRQICEVAQQCAAPVYVVTPWIERYQEVIPNDVRLIQEVPLPKETTPHGPLVGFAQGLAQVETDWVLLLACDLPQLQVAVLQDWVGRLETVPEEAIAFLPRHPKGWWEPLCGFYRRQCFPLLTNYIKQDKRSFQGWLAQHPVEELQVKERSLLFNCNTPDDLKEVNNRHQNEA